MTCRHTPKLPWKKPPSAAFNSITRPTKGPMADTKQQKQKKQDEEQQQQQQQQRRRNHRLRTTWCCAASIPNSPDRRSPYQALKERSDGYPVPKDALGGSWPKEKPSGPRKNKNKNKNEKKNNNKAEEAKCIVPGVEVGALIKQQRILSPGRVSPIEEPSANQGREPSPAPPPARASPPLPPASPAKQGSSTLQQIMNHEAESDSKASASPALKLQAKLPAAAKSKPAPRGRRSGDVNLTLKSKDGRAVTLDLHSEVLISQSGYFCSKLSTDGPAGCPPYSVEVFDCPDLESYEDTIELMYCPSPRKRLMQRTASSVLGILEVSARISFETGVKTCLECLEAMPWTEEDEERVKTLLTQFRLDKYAIQEVLGRLNLQEQIGSENLLMHVIQSVTRGKDEKARREMKYLVSRMLREKSNCQNDPSNLLNDHLYGLCHGCLDCLIKLFMQATSSNLVNDIAEDKGSLITQIARQVDNLGWLFEILIDRLIADDFVRIWANCVELLELYKKTSVMVRYELSRLTAKLFMALGKGQILCPWDVRYSLLQNWLQPLVDDFGWIQRSCKGLDLKLVEESINQTILTLPMQQQQSILMCWLECFSNSRNDCPNLHKAFEVWWRRSLMKPPEVHATTADLTC